MGSLAKAEKEDTSKRCVVILDGYPEKGEHLRFEQVHQAPQTCKWIVLSAHDGSELNLGEVYYRPTWRKYVALLWDMTDWDEKCLQQLADFVKERNRLRREGLSK